MLFGRAGVFLVWQWRKIMVETTNSGNAGLLFSKNFIDWFKQDFPSQNWLKDQYVSFDEVSGAYALKVDFNAVYRNYFSNLAYNGVLEQADPGFADTGMLIDLIYGELIKPESRAAFTQLVNLRLKEFNAPLKFVNGGFENIGAEADAPTVKTINRVTVAHKVAAALFIVIIMLSVMRGC